MLCHSQELLLSGSLGLRYSADEGAKIGAKILPKLCEKTPAEKIPVETLAETERSLRKKQSGPREDKLVRGRHMRRFLLSSL